LRDKTRATGALFIMNDRPDIALLADADGVHVGQDELPVADVRQLVGPDRLIGVSTHSLEQARQAVADGADYIGVGPTFPSTTKQFAGYPGLELVRQVSREVTLPAFAIGGITAENVPQVLAAGCRRIAVSHAILGAADPAQAARQLLACLPKLSG
jgi:thiamine-phosphate pyrophosphorylase